MSSGFKILSRIRGPRLFGGSGVRAHSLLSLGQPLILEREPSNPVDPSAVIVRTLLGEPVGYVQRPHSTRVAALIDSGRILLARIARPSVVVRPGVRRLALALIWDDGALADGQQATQAPRSKRKRAPVAVPEPIDG